MSSGSSRSFSLYGGAVSILLYNPTVAHALPHPNETWTRSDVGEGLVESLIKLESHGIVEVAERRRHRDDECHLYRTNRRAYEYVQSNIDAPNTLPCGHRGFRNVEGGGFTCTNDECTEEFDRETAEEVLRA